MLFQEKLTIVRSLIVMSVLALSTFGLMALWPFGAEQSLFFKQLIWALVGASVAFFIYKSDLSFFSRPFIIGGAYLISIFVLIIVLLFGDTVNGAQSWFNVFGISIQPSEFMKITFLLIVSKYLSRRHIASHDWKHVFVLTLYMIVPVLLIFLQPDPGSAFVIFSIWISLIVLAGLSRAQFLTFILAGIVIAASLWSFALQDYQKDRILTFISPLTDTQGAGYNAYQSLIAVGSGQTIGKGAGEGGQTRLNFLPEAETDFIFAAIAEERGFVGSLSVIITFLILLSSIVALSAMQKKSLHSFFLIGASVYLLSHITINIGMNIGIFPITGIPLPFISYGGSHILTEFIILGIVLNFTNKKFIDR